MLRHRFLMHSGELGDLARELLIEKLPSFAARQLRGHDAAARAILAFHGDYLEHPRPPSLGWAWDSPRNSIASMIARILQTRRELWPSPRFLPSVKDCKACKSVVTSAG